MENRLLPPSPRPALLHLLAASGASRPPVLRRSRKPDWLYAADLPLCAAPEACLRFRRRAEEDGWETAEENGWILLRKRSLLPENWADALPAAGEAGCLRSLKARHPGLSLSDGEAVLLLKALETRPEALEDACRLIHRSLARRLREERTESKEE